MRGWNLFFFEPGRSNLTLAEAEEWNCGAYLIEGAGDRGACHSPKKLPGACGRVRVAADRRPTAFTMPANGWKLTDEETGAETGAVATHVRNDWATP